MPDSRTAVEGEGRKRQRNSLACKRCRQRKIKCEKDDGTGCQACRNAHGVENCDYLRVNSNSIDYLTSFSPNSSDLGDYYTPPHSDGLFHMSSGRYDPGQYSVADNTPSQIQYSNTMPISMPNIVEASTSSQPSGSMYPLDRTVYGGGFDQLSSMSTHRQGSIGETDHQTAWYGSVGEFDMDPSQLWVPSARPSQSLPTSGPDYNNFTTPNDLASSHYANADVSPKTRPLPQVEVAKQGNHRDLLPSSRTHYRQSQASSLPDVDYGLDKSFPRTSRSSLASTIQESSIYSDSLRGSQSSNTPAYLRTPRSSADHTYTAPLALNSGFDQSPMVDDTTMSPNVTSRLNQSGKNSFYQPHPHKMRDDSHTTDPNNIGKPSYRRIRPMS